MEEMERIRSDLSQLTRRVDDFSLRLAVVEASREGFDEKLDGLRDLMEAKMTAMSATFTLQMGIMQKSIDTWNKLGFWLITTIGGAIIVAVLALVIMKPGA